MVLRRVVSDEHAFEFQWLTDASVTVWSGSLPRVETVYRRLTRNEEADFRGTKREENMPWFGLIGDIANGGNPTNDGTPEPHESFFIGDGCEYPAQSVGGVWKPGYLYGFANDAWHFYHNNRGSVTLTVKRVS